MPLDHEGAPRYRAYVLRMWAVNAGAWRFSLVDPETNEKHGFPDLAALTDYLQVQTESGADEPAPSDLVEK